MAKNGEPDYDQLGDEGECKVKIICLGDSAVGKSKYVQFFHCIIELVLRSSKDPKNIRGIDRRYSMAIFIGHIISKH